MTDNDNHLPNEFEPELPDELVTEGMPDPMVDPTQVITIRTSGGETRFIPATEPMSLAEVKAVSGLTFGAVQFYLNAAVIDDDTVIPVGSVISAIGNVKGG
jgi:hypothetical protein